MYFLYPNFGCQKDQLPLIKVTGLFIRPFFKQLGRDISRPFVIAISILRTIMMAANLAKEAQAPKRAITVSIHKDDIKENILLNKS